MLIIWSFQKNSNYLIGYLDKVIQTLALILLKMSQYLNIFKDKGGYNDNKLCLCV